MHCWAAPAKALRRILKHWLRLAVPPSHAPVQAETLVGVMSDKALDALISSRGKFNMSSNW